MTEAQRIAQLEAELAQVRQEMQAFMSAVSHDLRAPLRHIVSFARLLEEEAGPKLEAEHKGFLGTMTDSAQHMGAMLDALRELARLGTVPVVQAPVALDALVAGVSEELALRHAPRTLACDVAFAPYVVHTDAGLLRAALHAVLDNAWKFTAQLPQGTATVALALEETAGGVWLTVQDNGAGFRAAQPEVALRMFGRLHGAKPFAGLGAGLAWAAQALQRLGGSITLQAVEPAGCAVRLWIPLAHEKSPDMPGLA